MQELWLPGRTCSDTRKPPAPFHREAGGRKALSDEKARFSMTASNDLHALIEARRCYGVESWTYRMLLAGLTDTVQTIGIERFLDDVAGAAK